MCVRGERGCGSGGGGGGGGETSNANTLQMLSILSFSSWIQIGAKKCSTWKIISE